MKILYIHFSLGAGGAERFLVDLANRMATNYNNEVTVLTVFDSNDPSRIHFLPELSNKIRFINLHQKKGISLKSIIGIWKTIKRIKPNVVHAHCSFWLILFPAIFYRKPSYVMTIHSLVQRWAPSKLSRKLTYWLYKDKVQAVTISQVCHQSYIDYYHMDNDIIIDNGRESIKPSNKINAIEKYITALKKSNDTPVFVHIARHHPVKNHERLFKTFCRLSEEGIDFQLIVIGDRYEKYLEKFQNHPNIHLVGKQENIGDYLFFADYFVLTSDKEGMPITLLEAMSLGITPVCTPAGGIVDVIEDGKNGYMPSKIDDELYYQTVKRALLERHKISRQYIIDTYESKYSMGICAEKYNNVYKRNIYDKEQRRT